MQRDRRRRWLPVLILVLLTQGRAAAQAQPEPAVPRLAVLVVFDQMRGDYLDRWGKHFADDGFRRLEREGAWFTHCHYPYAVTFTAAGHASFLTGCSPVKHGIIANEWYDRASGEVIYCVDSARYQQVPPAAVEAGQPRSKLRADGASPDRLLAPSISDVLKAATDGKAKVVALSMKDRSAVLPGGRRPDACYWFDSSIGGFVTSTYYRDRVHSWVADFNQARPADRWFNKDWTRLHPSLDYARDSSADDSPGEGKGVLQGRTFPHPLDGGLLKPGQAYYEALYTSPFSNNLLLDLAKRAIEAEGLGRDDVPDLLSISFSANDAIGHIWGPDSQEVLDVTLRSDLIVKDLLTFLDKTVGPGRYVLALSADHGVCPLPETAQAKGEQAVRLVPKALALRIEEFMHASFGKAADDRARWLDAFQDPWVYFNHDLLRERKLEPAQVESALARWLKQQPEVLTAYTRTQLSYQLPPDDVMGERYRRSFHPERSGDVAVVVKPGSLITRFLDGTTHGSPHPYDTHVPLLVLGPGIPGGIRVEPVSPQAIAPIFAALLRLKSPAAAEVPVPDSLFRKP